EGASSAKAELRFRKTRTENRKKKFFIGSTPTRRLFANFTSHKTWKPCHKSRKGETPPGNWPEINGYSLKGNFAIELESSDGNPTNFRSQGQRGETAPMANSLHS
ncbi:MAG: hypothetical protein KC964_22695, partial [Candidatus Omnitrophica bacterium]|nr:hypothetical protein [Candidatus Omnitrophota bacterium]